MLVVIFRAKSVSRSITPADRIWRSSEYERRLFCAESKTCGESCANGGGNTHVATHAVARRRRTRNTDEICAKEPGVGSVSGRVVHAATCFTSVGAGRLFRSFHGLEFGLREMIAVSPARDCACRGRYLPSWPCDLLERKIERCLSR